MEGMFNTAMQPQQQMSLAQLLAQQEQLAKMIEAQKNASRTEDLANVAAIIKTQSFTVAELKEACGWTDKMLKPERAKAEPKYEYEGIDKKTGQKVKKTWTGKGRTPIEIEAYLKVKGHKIEDLKIKVVQEEKKEEVMKVGGNSVL